MLELHLGFYYLSKNTKILIFGSKYRKYLIIGVTIYY